MEVTQEMATAESPPAAQGEQLAQQGASHAQVTWKTLQGQFQNPVFQ